MTAYRFCRTDDMGLLVEAHERCRGPEDAGEPALDRDGFKRLVRDLITAAPPSIRRDAEQFASQIGIAR